MIRKIVKSGSNILRKEAKPVKTIDRKVLQLIEDLKDTLKIQKDPEGVGLAACQIGENLSVFAMIRTDKKILIVINPEIVNVKKLTTKEVAKEPSLMEGCLSLPNYYTPLSRSKEVKLKYMDEKGVILTEVFKNFEAQIVQHEVDHLKGIMFVDRLLEQKKTLFKLVGNEWEEVEII